MEEIKNSIDFEVEKTRFYLGKSNRYIEVDEGDMNFPARIGEIRDEIEKYLSDLKAKYGIKQEEEIGDIKSGNIEEDLKVLKEADNFIKGRINYAFDYDVSSAAFGNASCMSVTKNGEYYFENFLNAILPIIEKSFDVRLNKLSVRVKSYTDRKGIHPALRK